MRKFVGRYKVALIYKTFFIFFSTTNQPVSVKPGLFLHSRKQSVYSPRVSKHRSPLDETRNLLQQTETHQQQRDKSQYKFTGKQIN